MGHEAKWFELYKQNSKMTKTILSLKLHPEWCVELHIELFFALSLPFIDPLFYIIRIRLITYGSCCEFTPPQTDVQNGCTCTWKKKIPFINNSRIYIISSPPPPQEENNNNVYVVRMKNLFSFLFLFFAKYYWDHYSNTVSSFIWECAKKKQIK